MGGGNSLPYERNISLSATDEELLTQAMENSSPMIETRGNTPDLCSTPSSSQAAVTALEFKEWSCEPNGVYRATCNSVPTLPADAYAIRGDDRGLYFQRLTISTDSLIILDDTASQRVVGGIRKFWQSKERYHYYQVLFKRGILLWGPAGSGKTGTVMLLAHELIALGGMVVMVTHPGIAGDGLARLRRIEPERPLIAVFEDIDELIKEYGEHSILALLDGEFQIPNVVNIATTNYPERLGPRIINRPSRFDERIFIDTPNAVARGRYLAHITRHDPPGGDEIACWVEATKGFSIAHLREMVIAVRCLGQDYDEVILRLKAMHKQVRPIEGYPGTNGFGAPGMLQAQQNKK